MRRDPFPDLRAAYRTRRVVLALGAGVSKGCGLPEWNGLIRGLIRKHLKQPRPSYARIAEYFEHNPLRIAELIRDHFPGRAAFANAIRRELYSTGAFRRFYDEGGTRQA